MEKRRKRKVSGSVRYVASSAASHRVRQNLKLLVFNNLEEGALGLGGLGILGILGVLRDLMEGGYVHVCT